MKAIGIVMFLGALLAAIIDHRILGHSPNAMIVVIGFLGLIISFIGKASNPSALDPGWINLQRAKAGWQRLVPYLDGTINTDASAYKSHSSVCTAHQLISEAIDLAPKSNADPVRAVANEAIAWQEKGLLHRATNEFAEARHCFEKSLSILNDGSLRYSMHPRILGARRETLFRLAELNQIMGYTQEARIGYQKSLEIDALLKHDDPVGEATTKKLLSSL